eukprot:CAMPEP_0181422388 /NCGR_PEP_ID=MMETSP1110-20121109/13589_1 /TAXON_ID=174948 /ORGANISM="Symbiodinium sp., Strain CCMP421" /LENGTH=768 /DNA_ID=CAMNT_0023545485 /DNA_START=74 /DNA_END=2377 /DNA_ORIENTATION=-
MAPRLSKTAAAAGAVAGCAFVTLPNQRSKVSGGLRGAAASSTPATGLGMGGSVLSTVGVALGASALAAASRKEAPVARRAFEGELGVQAPVGFWDPAGFTADGDAKDFYRRRVVEIKHGRVSMLACTGYIVQEFVRFPGSLSPSSDLKFADLPNGLAAVTKVPAVGWFQYTIFCGICDLWLMHQVPSNPPGKLQTRLFGESTTNYEYGFLGLPGYLGGKAITDEETKKKKLNAELANGRLAMMAIIGMFFQDGLTGSAWGDWANYTDSPLRAFESELGVQAPLGYFDPLGLSKDGDVETFRRRRESELKNGRVAMFATIGYMVPEYFKFPGYLAPSASLKFADVPNGIQAITKVPAEGWLQWVALCGCYELCVNQPVDAADPGNYGKGKLGYGNMVLGITAESISDPEARKRGLNSELANGRLAMMAIMGLWVQDGLFGTPYGLYAGSSAFEKELGVQPPVGFWDPLGFTAGGDAASFRRRRYVELKHGRVAMFACLGYIVPEYYRWPGDLSPSLGLKFSDVPAGFAAFSKVPLSGWAQMVAFAGSVELFQYNDDPKRPPGDFENAGFLGVPNGFLKAPAGTKEKKLAAEIANGRLAMMAIIGMFFQDGLTGSAWGDWALYTDSPLRALTPAQESIAGTGGPFPENFWDPAGITSKKSKEEILELRAIELKHGRVAMLAVLGWFHVAAGFHIIGDLATQTYLDNNPLVSLTQLPMGGMWQTVFFIMCLEWVGTYVCPPPKDKPWDVLGWSDILLEDEDNYWNQFRKAE